MFPCSVSMRTHYPHILSVCTTSQEHIAWRIVTEVRGGKPTSSPSGAIVLASEYPGNSNHCPTLGPSPLRARSSDSRRRVFPDEFTTGEAIWFDMAMLSCVALSDSTRA